MGTKQWVGGLAAVALALGSLRAAEVGAPYPAMAPLARYQSTSVTEEIELARSAAPHSISAHAEVLALGAHGYDTVVKGSNGFVCLVERSWAMVFSDPEFWNPRFRAPICHNRAAARSILPSYLERTAWVLTGVPTSDMSARTQSELASGKFGLPETGAMSYMMSKQTHLHDADGHWHSHLMFYLANTTAGAWGANLEGSPVFADAATLLGDEAHPEPVITFFVPVTRWSDGTPETSESHH
jgi:hypothetical protein